MTLGQTVPSSPFQTMIARCPQSQEDATERLAQCAAPHPPLTFAAQGDIFPLQECMPLAQILG